MKIKYQNNYIKCRNCKKFWLILTINLSILHNYFDNPTTLFLDLYLVEFLD